MKEKKKDKFIIEGFLPDDKIWWKKNIQCVCNNSNDIHHCKRCKYQHQENEVPRKSFVRSGKTITKIKVVRGRDGDLICIEF